jgi:membrane protein DedA with SNARE-associated domain
VIELLDWLGGLPAPLLYLVIAAAAFAENIFPPLPADTAIALGAFVAARGEGSAVGAWAATMLGNLGGAFMMFMLGRRLGSGWLERKLPALGGPDGAARVESAYRTHGIWALAVSRFIPAVRAIVPPLAGALRVGVVRAMIAMSVASAIWYGLITWFAFTLGANAETLLARIGSSQRTAAIIAVGIVLVAAGVWWARRRTSREGNAHDGP